MSTILTCWLNTTSPTSESKPCIWLVEKSGLLKGSVFVNLESDAHRDQLMGILREAFDVNVSYELLVDVNDIDTKSKSMNIKLELETVMDNMTEVVRAVAKPVDAKVLAKADALLANLKARQKRVVVGGPSTDDDILVF
jgi:hypothetical protein